MLPNGIRTTDVFICLDGEMLNPGERIEVLSNYPGSEVSHYDGMHGYVRECTLDDLRIPVVIVRLEGVNGLVTLYPFELMHEERVRDLDDR